MFALNLLNERNCRVAEGLYRNSISLAMATLALPFVELECDHGPGELWEMSPESTARIRTVLDRLFRPQTMMNRMTESALRVLILQALFADPENLDRMVETKSYAHARELLLIRTAVMDGDVDAAARLWPAGSSGLRRPGKRPRRRRNPKEGKKSDA